MLGRVLGVSLGVLLLVGSGCGEVLGGRDDNWLDPMTPEGHIVFPVTAGTVHAMDCDVCHGGFETFKEFTCISCHEHSQEVLDPIHIGINPYYSSPQCYDCHPDGTAAAGMARDQHEPMFPIDVGTNHAEVACNSCHVDPTDRSVNACAECHYDQIPTLDDSHNQINDYVPGDHRMCKMCHADGVVPIRFQEHRNQHFGMQGPGAHRRCTQCHADRRTDRPFEAALFTTFTCEGLCHEHTQNKTNNQHQGENGYAYDFPLCVQCHPTGRKD